MLEEAIRTAEAAAKWRQTFSSRRDMSISVNIMSPGMVYRKRFWMASFHVILGWTSHTGFAGLVEEDSEGVPA